MIKVYIATIWNHVTKYTINFISRRGNDYGSKNIVLFHKFGSNYLEIEDYGEIKILEKDWSINYDSKTKEPTKMIFEKIIGLIFICKVVDFYDWRT